MPWWALFIIVCLYAYRYTAYELILWGILYDSSIGIHTSIIPFPYMYTVTVCAVVLAMQLLKPVLLLRSS